MKYMGSKAKVKQYILPIIKDRIQTYGCDKYVEPFVGGANVIDSVTEIKRIGADKNKYLIELYKHLDDVKNMPDIITKEHYSDVRNCYNKNDNCYEDWYIGAVGFLSSYNGRFFDGGYSGIRTTANGTERNYYLEAKRNLLKQAPDLQGIKWLSGDYRVTCDTFENACIYCDIPYKNTKQYGTSRDFNYFEFWDWARRMSKKNIVLISEHTAPNDFDCIWELPQKRTIDCHSTKLVTEKLFEIRN